MKNLYVSQVVAFDKTGEALTSPLGKFNVAVDLKAAAATIKNGRYSKVYELSRDVVCLFVGEVKKEFAIAKTLGRMALTGVATNGFARGKGVPGAVMDYAMRGSETNDIVEVTLVFKDTTVCHFDVTAKELQKLRSIVPQDSQRPSAMERVADTQGLIRRVHLDGQRAITELEVESAGLREDLKVKKSLVDTCSTFAQRDAARLEVERLSEVLELKEVVIAAALYAIANEQGASLKWGLKGWLLLMVVVIAALAIAGNAARDTNKLKETSQSGKPFTPHSGVDRPAIQLPKNLIEEVVPDTASPVPADSSDLSRPSFNCAKASSLVEKLICNSEPLAMADRRLAEAYKVAVQRAESPKELKSSQNYWRINERDLCLEATCVMTAYERRIAELQTMSR